MPDSEVCGALLGGHRCLGILLLAVVACRPAERTAVEAPALEAFRHPTFNRTDWLQPSVPHRFEFSRAADLAGWEVTVPAMALKMMTAFKGLYIQHDVQGRA